MGTEEKNTQIAERGADPLQERDFYSSMQSSDIAAHFVKSDFFQDAQDVSKAVVKILAGQELGIPPVAAMRNLDFFEGQLSMRSRMMLAKVKESERYDYRVGEWTDEKCTLTFFEVQDGERVELGSMTWTLEDAERVTAWYDDDGNRKTLLDKDNWKNYPKKMLLWRAASDGCDAYCPDLFYGAYTPEELSTGLGAQSVAQQIEAKTKSKTEKMKEELLEEGNEDEGDEEEVETESDESGQASIEETKTTCGDFGGMKAGGEPCTRAAGWGTEEDEGRCSRHRDGDDTDEGADGLSDDLGGKLLDVLQDHGLSTVPFIDFLDDIAERSTIFKEAGVTEVDDLLEIPEEFARKTVENPLEVKRSFLQWKRSTVDSLDESKRLDKQISEIEEQMEE